MYDHGIADRMHQVRICYICNMYLDINALYQILKALYMGDDIHLHNVAKNPELLTLWKTAEARNRIPLCFNDPEILQSNPKWVFEPGIHLCIHQESNEVVFAARIRWVFFSSS